MKDFPSDGWEFEAGERGLPGLSVTSLDTLNWAWSDFHLLPSSARISYSSKDSSLKPLDCDQWTDISSWYQLESHIPFPMELCLELEKNWTREFGVACGEVTSLLSLQGHRLEVCWLYLFLLFHHFLFILITFIINVLIKGLPPSILVATQPQSHLHPA